MSDLMPWQNGITGYFDMSSVDLANNKWRNIAQTNLVDKHDISLTGGKLQNNALYLASTDYGLFPMSTEAQTLYCVFKVVNLQQDWMPIIAKQMTVETGQQYNYSIHLSTNGTIVASASFSDVDSGIMGTDYHVVCVTKNNNTMYLYVDGKKIGTATAYDGLYSGNFYLNKLIRGTSSVTLPTDVEYRMCAFGTMYHDDSKVRINSAFLLNGVKPVDNEMSGADAAAIAWCIKQNIEQAKSINLQKKAYRKGLKRGGNEVTEPITEPFDNDFDLIPDDIPINMLKGVYIKTGEITVDGVTGVFQLRIYAGELITIYGSDGRCDWGLPPVVTLTGNGITKTLILGDLETNKGCWEGSTSASAPGVQDGNEYYMTTATVNKSTATIGGKYYWEYSGGYYDRYWTLTGDFAKALQAGQTISTLPFDDIT